MKDLQRSFVAYFVVTFSLQAVLKVSGTNQTCRAGFTGSNCSTDINDCIGVTCSGNGNCSDRVDGYICFCKTGFFGINCEVDAAKCSSSLCKNNGTCIKQGSSFTCNCPAAYEGKRCESKKPPIKFSVTTTLRRRQYIADYADVTKPKTRALIAELTSIFLPFFRKMFPDFLAITFLRFSSGSIVTNFDITFESTTNVSSSSIIQVLRRGNNTRDLQFLILEEIKVGNEDTTAAAATDSSSELATWEIILIVTGAVLFIILILVIITVLYRRKVKRERETIPGHGDWNPKNASIKKREI